MINEKTIREWYIPAEILALRNWLIAATIVNVLLLTFDYLRGDDQLFDFGRCRMCSTSSIRSKPT